RRRLTAHITRRSSLRLATGQNWLRPEGDVFHANLFARRIKLRISWGGAMLDELKIPKTLARRLEKVAAIAHVDPESIVKSAIKDRLDYLEWKENAIAEGLADLDAGRVVTTEQLRASIASQRTHRAKRKKAA
ncbi:MAG: CopG family ribbon-helix-helix protein, partial [Sulfuricella sp.]